MITVLRTNIVPTQDFPYYHSIFLLDSIFIHFIEHILAQLKYFMNDKLFHYLDVFYTTADELVWLV